jgi:hypothetical protein
MAGTMTSEKRRRWAVDAIGLGHLSASMSLVLVSDPLWSLLSRIDRIFLGLNIGMSLIAVASGLVILVAPRRRPPRRALPQDPGPSPLFDRELDGLP